MGSRRRRHEEMKNKHRTFLMKLQGKGVLGRYEKI